MGSLGENMSGVVRKKNKAVESTVLQPPPAAAAASSGEILEQDNNNVPFVAKTKKKKKKSKKPKGATGDVAGFGCYEVLGMFIGLFLLVGYYYWSIRNVPVISHVNNHIYLGPPVPRYKFEYSMQELLDYPYKLSTPRGAKFFVPSTIAFDEKFPPNSPHRLEIERIVDLKYKLHLVTKCMEELKRAKVAIDYDYDNSEQARETIDCDKLKNYGLE